MNKKNSVQKTLILIPAFNEESNIGVVLAGVKKAVPDLDIVVINDGSVDSTAKIVSDLGVNQIILPVNMGYSIAVQTGLRYALEHGYSTVVLIDSDRQHDPADIPKLIDALNRTQADVIIGSRSAKEVNYKIPFDRKVGMWFFSLATYLVAKQRIHDTTSGFKAFRIEACKKIGSGHFIDFHAETLISLLLAGFKVIEYPIQVSQREYGNSMYSLSSLITYPLRTSLIIAITLIEHFLEKWRKPS